MAASRSGLTRITRDPSVRRRVTAGLLAASAIGGASILALPSAHAQRPQGAIPGAPVALAPYTFADIAEKVRPAVVSIHVTAGAAPRVAAPGRGGGRDPLPELPDDHPLKEFFKNLPREFGGGGSGGPEGPRRSMAQGSGFVISADGYVVTNNHVISGGSKIQVSFDEREKIDAELIGTDPRTDIALLKITNPKTPMQYVRFASKPVRVGDWVLAVGNPFGLGGTVTAGIVSALSRDIGSGPYDFLQIDAAVNKGNSGGPTFNLEGEVVGVNTAIYSPSGGNVGIAFAVPAKTANDVVEQLRVNKTVSRGWLGVKIESVDEEKATTLGLNEPRGALVNEVTAGGPAASSTLRAGDVVLSVNDQKVDNSRDLARKIAEFSPGTTVSLEVSRYGKTEIVQVKLGTFPTDPQVAAQPKPETKAGEAPVASLGLTLGEAPRGAKADGVAVRQVESGSDASFKGIKVGDIIIEVQGQAVKSAKDVEDAVKKARADGRKGVLLRVRQGETARFIAVQLKNE